MEKSLDIIQKSQIDDNRFNQTWFIELVKNLSSEEFNRFCKEVVHLHHYYATSLGAYCTDRSEISIANPDIFWQLDEIDFDAPVDFKRIK